MEAKFLHEGKAIDYIPQEDIPAGSVVNMFDFVGVTHRDIAEGQLGALYLEGVYEVPKITMPGSGIMAGYKVYWDPISRHADPDPEHGVYMGKAVKDAAENDVTVTVRLDQ